MISLIRKYMQAGAMIKTGNGANGSNAKINFVVEYY